MLVKAKNENPSKSENSAKSFSDLGPPLELGNAHSRSFASSMRVTKQEPGHETVDRAFAIQKSCVTS